MGLDVVGLGLAKRAATVGRRQALVPNTSGLRVAFFGDSLPSYGEGYPNLVAILSKQKVQISTPGKERMIVSYPGADSATLLTHITDVTSMNPLPDVVHVQAGTNDAIASVSVATFLANVKAIYAAFEAVGIKVMMSTIPPLGGAFQYNALTGPARRYNTVLRVLAGQTGRLLTDPYASLVETSSGRYAAAYDSGDNVHPNTAGVAVWAQRILDDLAPYLGPVPVIGEVSSGGTGDGNLVAASTFRASGGNYAGSASTGLAAGLAATTARTGATPTLVANTDAAGWYWQRITMSGATQQQLVYTPNHTLTPGRLMLASCMVRTQQAGTGKQMLPTYVEYLANGTTVNASHPLTGPVGSTRQIADGACLQMFRVAANTVAGQFQFLAGSGDGIYDFGLPTVYDLTALGLDPA